MSFDARRLEPVAWEVEMPRRMSVTLGKKMDNCPRDGGLYLKYRGGASSGPLLRGSLVHLFHERMMATLIERGEQSLVAPQPGEDPAAAMAEVAQTTGEWIDELVEETGWPLSESEIDEARVMAYHIAIGNEVDPETVVALEQAFVLELEDGGELIGKVDLASIGADGVLQVDDLKTAPHVPTEDEVQRLVQTPWYAACLLWGRPIAWDEDGNETLGEPLGLDHVQWVRCRQTYPRFLSPSGFVTSRGGDVLLGRADLRKRVRAASRAWRRLERGVNKREWPAKSGEQCSECTAEAECPLPRQLRRFAGAIQSVEQAQEAMTWHRRQSSLLKATREEVVNFLKANDIGSLRVDAETFAFVVSHPRSLRRRKGEADWDGLQEAVEAAAEEGVPFHVNDWIRSRPRSEFKAVKVNEIEEAEQDG